MHSKIKSYESMSPVFFSPERHEWTEQGWTFAALGVVWRDGTTSPHATWAFETEEEADDERVNVVSEATM